MMTSQQQQNNRNINNGGDQLQTGQKLNSPQRLSDVTLGSGLDQNTGLQNGDQTVKPEKSPMSKQTIILLVLGSLTSAVLLGLLIYNIVEMNKAKDKVCSLEKNVLKSPQKLF